MINLKSTAVKVFPSAFRGLAENGTTQYNPEARLTTEFNVTNLTNRLSSKDSFVIDWTGSIATFNIHGYYFEATLTELLAGEGADWDDVYAYIRVLPFQPTDVGNTTYQAFTLVGAGDDGTTVLPRILDETLSSVDTFMGLGLQGTQETGTLDTGVYELHLLYKDGEEWSVPTASKLKFKSTEIEDYTTGKSIYEELSTGKINNIKVTKPANGATATLTIAEGKTLKADQSITLAGDALRKLTLNDADKTLAGAGTSLTIDNDLDIAGTTGQITLGTNPYTLKFTTTGDTTLTLPTTGTLATTSEPEAFTNKTSYNGLTLTATSYGFQIAHGAVSKALIVNETYTLGPACAKNFNNSGTASALSSAGQNLVTERAVFFGLPIINNSHSYDASTRIFAPTTSGTAGHLLMSEGYLTTPTWANPSTITVGNATKTSFTNHTFSPSISISSSGESIVSGLNLGKTYQIYISFGEYIDIQHSLGLVTIPTDTGERVYTVFGALGHYLEILTYNPSVMKVTCWRRFDTTPTKLACNLYFKLIS